MAAAESKSVMLQQLSRQLHAVSEIAESLTLRLLALEERFEQLHLDAWSDGTDSGQDVCCDTRVVISFFSRWGF